MTNRHERLRVLAGRRLWIFTLAALVLIAAPAWAQKESAHGDPVAPLVLALAAVLLAGKLGGDLAARAGQPAVLGELLAGVVLGNATLLGFHTVDALKTDANIALFANLGVLILLFEVGLESTVAQMLTVGGTSLLVATLGVLAPFGLGWGVGAWLLPEASLYTHAFLGATLCATSVGITARLLQDLGRSKSQEARVILGAAIIDDVLGLVVLAVVTGAIIAESQGGSLSILTVGATAGTAVAFLGGALVIGATVTPRLFSLAATSRARGVLLTVSLSFCFVLAWLADRVGLAPIVGAFAAGLILEEVHSRDFVDRGEHQLEELIRPISDFLAPIFFVLMGLRTELSAFSQPGVLGLAAALTVAAILGKQACSLGVLTPGVDRLSVGIGMVPRGEVGLIFANIGVGLTLNGTPIIDQTTFSAVVAMIIVTTMITPPTLKWSLARRR